LVFTGIYTRTYLFQELFSTLQPPTHIKVRQQLSIAMEQNITACNTSHIVCIFHSAFSVVYLPEHEQE